MVYYGMKLSADPATPTWRQKADAEFSAIVDGMSTLCGGLILASLLVLSISAAGGSALGSQIGGWGMVASTVGWMAAGAMLQVARMMK